VKKTKEWTADEIFLLNKGLIKFPPSYKNRWRLISEMLDERFTTKEVIAKCNEIKTGLDKKTGVTS
jgi:hypothetical protein